MTVEYNFGAVDNIIRLTEIPSIDRLLQSRESTALIAAYGRTVVIEAIRCTVDGIRVEVATDGFSVDFSVASVFDRVARSLKRESTPSLRPVVNLTGTVLHTNLGRASLPREAVDAAMAVALGASNLEYDLAHGKRGDRDDHVEKQICSLTGAEAATVVNNNAAAVMLVLNSLSAGREVPTSRGELVEIGGSFRMPDIMTSSGCRLREVGTTNRTHLRDYVDAIGPETGLVMKVHASNYEIMGFTASVDERQLAKVCRERGVPFVVDLGSGSLIDLRRYGLPHEPTPAETIAHESKVGSGAVPTRTLPSAGIAIRPPGAKARGTALLRIEAAFRALPVPVVGRLQDGVLILDFRCLEDPDGFVAQLGLLRALGQPV